MAERFWAALCALLLLAMPALGEMTVESLAGEAYFPDEKKWVYHFTYAYPQVAGDDYTAALINDTYQMALDEMLQLVLPMFANAPDMRFDGKNEVKHDFEVMCNDGRLLSILQYRSQTMGRDDVRYTLEPLTFDVSGIYAGETLTLRGVILVQAGVDPEKLDSVTAEDYPALAGIIDSSSSLISEVMQEALYGWFKQLQQEGLMDAQWTREDYEAEFIPSRDFYATDQGGITFFLPPSLLATPSPYVPSVSYFPDSLNALMLKMAGENSIE